MLLQGVEMYGQETIISEESLLKRLDELEKELHTFKRTQERMEETENRVKYLERELHTYKETEERMNQLSEELVYDVLPLGTILPWLPTPGSPGVPDSIPSGWVECNGSYITEGPWYNLLTPNLNNPDDGFGLFLRGGNQSEAGKMETDAIQRHSHEDFGHNHIDNGHTHFDHGHAHTDAGHSHGHPTYRAADTTDPVRPDDPGEGIGVAKGGYHSTTHVSTASIQPSYADISDSQADIQVGYASIGDPVNSRTAEETRPVNMKVTWIMKINHPGSKGEGKRA